MPLFATLSNMYCGSNYVASAASGALMGVYSVAVNAASAQQQDTSSNYFQLFFGLDWTNFGWGVKTMILKYDNALGGTGNIWLQHYDSLTVSAGARLMYPGDGFLMQSGDELVVDFDDNMEIYACCQSGSGAAALSWMLLG
jgi:hypothetical protein